MAAKPSEQECRDSKFVFQDSQYQSIWGDSAASVFQAFKYVIVRAASTPSIIKLNMYNFHKVRGDKNEFEFEHDKFIKDRPDLLHEIKRKQV